MNTTTNDVLTYDEKNLWTRLGKWTDHTQRISGFLEREVGQTIPIGMNTMPEITIDEWISHLDDDTLLADVKSMHYRLNETPDIVGWLIDERLDARKEYPDTRVSLCLICTVVTEGKVQYETSITGLDIDETDFFRGIRSRVDDAPPYVIAFTSPEESARILELIELKHAMAEL